MNNDEKVFGVLAYFGILFLVPLLAGKTEFSKFHANQGLILFLGEIITNAVGGFITMIPIFGWIIGLLFWAVDVFWLVLAIMGIVNACQGEMKELPLVGKFKIIK